MTPAPTVMPQRGVATGTSSRDDRINGVAVCLRPVLEDEAREVLAGRLPAHLRFAAGYPGESGREVMDIFAGERRLPFAFRPYFIVRTEDEAVVGHIGYSLPDSASSPVVGYDVVPTLWGRCYATDAFRVLIAYLFTLPDTERVLADTLAGHAASSRVMEKVGMSLPRGAEAEVDGATERVVYYEAVRPA